jgi:hypothetical protein
MARDAAGAVIDVPPRIAAFTAPPWRGQCEVIDAAGTQDIAGRRRKTGTTATIA